jgi:hypothetical protein
MADSDRPRSPFAGMADFSTRPPVRVLSPHCGERLPQLAGQRRLSCTGLSANEMKCGHVASYLPWWLVKRRPHNQLTADASLVSRANGPKLPNRLQPKPSDFVLLR